MKEPKPKPRKWIWLEEYGCGCTNVTYLRIDALGYCPIHGKDRVRIYKLPNNEMEIGYAR